MTLIAGMHGYTAEHAEQAVHTVLESKWAKLTVWLLWLLMLPNPGAMRKTRALHRSILLKATTRQFGIAQSVATNGVQQSKVELQTAVDAPSAIAEEMDVERMAQGTSIPLLQSVTTLC